MNQCFVFQAAFLVSRHAEVERWHIFLPFQQRLAVDDLSVVTAAINLIDLCAALQIHLSVLSPCVFTKACTIDS